VHAISFSEKGDYFVTVGVRLVKFWYIGSTDNANKVCHSIEKERKVRSKQMIRLVKLEPRKPSSSDNLQSSLYSIIVARLPVKTKYLCSLST
jgi:Iap family predicted aminopeptidase